MDCTLKRLRYRADGIFGQLFDDGGVQIAVTLEHAFMDTAATYSPAVPPGTYNCIRRLSPKFGFDVFMLENVPGHTFVEIHPGNWNVDSDGCLLLGDAIASSNQGQMITNSKFTFEAFMQIQEGVNEFTLAVIA